MPPKGALTIIKADGEKEAWDPKKLARSLSVIGVDKAIAQDIRKHIERDLRDGMRTVDIYNHAFALLKRYHRPTAAKYSLKKAILQLGPSGFPFERYVAHILEREGYRTKVGVQIRGMCVTHEVDVLAEKDDERIVVEAKYHNSAALKTDVKIALYVHARSQDILRRYESDDTAAPKERYNRSWLITNTSFTTQAIEYGTCVGLAMTGWNHPRGRTLQDLVEATQMHPITCLTTLSGPQKRVLLDRGKVLCREILTDLDTLKEIGLPRGRLAAVVEESTALCGIDDAVMNTTAMGELRV